MNTIDELKIAIDEAMSELSNRINEIEANKTNEPDDKFIGLDEFLKLQRENAVILQELTNDIRNSSISNKDMLMAISAIHESLIPKPELTEIPGGNFAIYQDEVDSNLKRIEDIKSILNGEYPDKQLCTLSYVDGSLPLIIDNKFSEIYAENVSVYMGRIYEYLNSYAFWTTVTGTPVHAKINMLLRRLKSLLNVDDLCIFDTENRGNVTRYIDAMAPSIKSAYDIAESSILWELENISNYLPVAFDEASRWRYLEEEYVYKTETESNEDASQDETPQDEPSDEYEKECVSSENDDSTDDSSESDFDRTPNDDDTENFPTMEKEEPSEETPEIKAEESEIGLILESESNASAPQQDETTSASSDVDWDNVVTCLFGYVNSAKRWINNDSVGDTGQIQIINHMGNLLSTKSSDIAGSYPIFSKTINQLAIDAKKPVKLPETIEEFSKEFMV